MGKYVDYISEWTPGLFICFGVRAAEAFVFIDGNTIRSIILSLFIRNLLVR